MPISNNTNVQLKLGNKDSNLNNLPVQDGNLIAKEIDDDNFKLYLDDTTRKELSVSNADKLSTPRLIYLSGATDTTPQQFDGTANLNIPVNGIYESYLNWGNKNLVGSVSPVDVACSNLLSANRFAFANPSGITVEYSTDGSNYSVYDSATDDVKTRLVSGIGVTLYIGGRHDNTSINDKLRITFNALDMGVYTSLKKILINILTYHANGCNVIIECTEPGSKESFVRLGQYFLSGWSGWNSIPVSFPYFGNIDYVAAIRLTFGITGITPNKLNCLTVSDITAIGTTYWTSPSTMATTGHLYGYDSSKNATFPANVTASRMYSEGKRVLTESDITTWETY